MSVTGQNEQIVQKLGGFTMPRAKPDRRVARTQQSLHRSLNTLILEKGYEATSIKDIVAHANVGRSTLYAHHGSKEDLLLSGLEHLRAALLSQRQAALAAPDRATLPVLGFSRVFFEHMHEYRDIFLALTKSPTGAVVTRKIKRLLADVVRQDLHAAKLPGRGDEIPRDAVVQFTVDALFSILLWWLEQQPKLPPAEADAIFRRLILPALAGAGLRNSRL
jgi:AcrR family transcriptional regulator